MNNLNVKNDINDYWEEIKEKVSELFKEGKISEALRDEFILVDGILRETDKSLVEFLAFMNAFKPDNMIESDIPEAVINAIEYLFKDYKSINFSLDCKKAMIYTAFQTTRFYHLQITDRYMEILKEIADKDTDLSNILTNLKSFMNQQQ